MAYKYCLKNGEIIIQSVEKGCANCETPKFTGSRTGKCLTTGLLSRYGYKESVNGYCFICSSQKKHARSANQFNEYLDMRGDVLEALIEYRAIIKTNLSDDFSRLLHNLTSLNGHNTQELYALVPQELATQNLRNCMDIIRKKISADPTSAAALFFQLQKNCSAIKTEFDVFKKLYRESPALSIEPHAIHRVIMNVAYVFFQDFSDKHCYINVKESTDWVLIDYETFRVALYHLFQNASKYVCPNTDIYIEINRNDPFLDISMNMISLQITDNDMRRLFEEGYSGELAKEHKLNGEGRGMSIVKKAIDINKGKIQIQRDITANNRKQVGSISYVNNVFILSAKKMKNTH
jgi:light-regulated signal transduction histidine kinase (bacteriophytochrome)